VRPSNLTPVTLMRSPSRTAGVVVTPLVDEHDDGFRPAVAVNVPEYARIGERGYDLRR